MGPPIVCGMPSRPAFSLLTALVAALLVPAGVQAAGPSPAFVKRYHPGTSAKAPLHADTPANIHVDLAKQVRDARLSGVRAFTVSGSQQFLPTSWCGAERTTDDVVDAAQLSDEPVYKVVYAYASDQPDRFDTWRNQLQANVSLIGQFMSLQDGATKSPRFDMGTSCGPRYVDIQTVALPGTRAYYIDNFSRITGDVASALGATPAKRNVVILADQLTANGPGSLYGLGQHYAADSAAASNPHNAGNLYAALFPPVGYSPPTSSGQQFYPGFWPEGMLHEMTHTLGAVNSTAPHATTAGHCTDGYDVMCYSDGGTQPTPYSTSACTQITGSGGLTQTYDCGGDDYFNPNPAPGSYLATHWNLYNNVFESSCATIGFACGADSAAAPSGVSAPRVTGTRKVTNTLTADHGTWSGTPTSFAYQWQRIVGANPPADIDGATAATYTLVPADANTQVQVKVTATNTNGSASNTSATSAIPAFNPPINSSPPSISGSALRTSVLTATGGSWTGFTGKSLKWQRLVSGTWTDIPSQTGATYTLVSADVGTSVRVLETATNADGPASSPSNAIGPVDGATPVVQAAPSITGTPQRTRTLTASSGTWSNGPTSYAYQWQQDAGGGFADVAGATDPTYLLGGEDLGTMLRVVVTASNVDGDSGPAASDPVGPVLDLQPPVNTTVPSVLGIAQAGQVLTATSGAWSNAPTSFTRHWQRSTGGVFSDIPQATGASYLLSSADVGHPVRVVVVATNAEGDSEPVASSATGAVAAAPLAPVVIPPVVSEIPQPVVQLPPGDVFKSAKVSLRRGKRTALQLTVTSRTTQWGLVATIPSKRVKVTRRGTYRLTLCANIICITKPFRARHGKAKLPAIVATSRLAGPVTLKLIGPGGLAIGRLP
jgi:hypothetical protein